MTNKITALVIDKFGDAKEVVRTAQVEKPKLSSENQVLIRVKASTVKSGDLLLISGGFPIRPVFPISPGMEGSGIVEQVGSAVTTIKVGQKVHFADSGAWAQYVVVDAGNVILVPDSYSFEEVAQYTSNPLTAIAMVRDLNIPKGEFLLQTAAGSNLARIIIRLAKEYGFKTINLVRRDSQVAELEAIGADYVINTEKADFVEEVNKITNGKGVSYAVDPVTGSLGAKLLNVLAHSGTLALYGRLSSEPYTLDPVSIVFKNLNIRGFTPYKVRREHPEKVKQYYNEILDLISQGKLPLPYQAFDAATQFKEALAHLDTSIHGEKTVLLF